MRLNQTLTRVCALLVGVILVGGLLTILLSTGCQAELPEEEPDLPGPPVREMPGSVKAGDELAIQVTFVSPNNEFHAIGLTEIAPAKWNVTVDLAWTDPQAMLAHSPDTETAEYIWEGPYSTGTEFTAVYRVKVPADTEPGTYTFSGSLEYYVQPHPAPSHEKEITGDIQVTVSSQGL